MDTSSSDSDGPHSPGVYNLSYATAVTGYSNRPVIKSPSRHSESSGDGNGSTDETRSPRSTAKTHHHKFSIDRILGRFGGGNATVVDAASSRTTAETSDSGKCHRNNTLSLQHGTSSKFSHTRTLL